jgi:predicted ester cyclase
MKNVVSKVFACLNTGVINGVEEFISPRYVTRNAAGAPTECLAPGPAGFVALVKWLRGAFSDLRFEIQETIAEGDRITVRVLMSGVQAHAFLGFPASGREFAVQQVHTFRVAGGRLVEHRSIRDDLSLMRQIGAIQISQTPSIERRASRVTAGPGRLRVV